MDEDFKYKLRICWFELQKSVVVWVIDIMGFSFNLMAYILLYFSLTMLLAKILKKNFGDLVYVWHLLVR